MVTEDMGTGATVTEALAAVERGALVVVVEVAAVVAATGVEDTHQEEEAEAVATEKIGKLWKHLT